MCKAAGGEKAPVILPSCDTDSLLDQPAQRDAFSCAIVALLLEWVAALLLELPSLVGSETHSTGGNPCWYCKPGQKLMARKVMGDGGSENCCLTNECSFKLPSKSLPLYL